MAENQFPSTVEALFKGMEHFVTTKTVVGEAVKVDENTIIIPLVDVTCGMAAGSFAQSAKTNGGGGMSAKMSPSAVLILQNGMTKLVNIKHQDAVTKILDMRNTKFTRIHPVFHYLFIQYCPCLAFTEAVVEVRMTLLQKIIKICQIPAADSRIQRKQHS